MYLTQNLELNMYAVKVNENILFGFKTKEIKK